MTFGPQEVLDIAGTDGKPLPAGLQPGSGSTDFFLQRTNLYRTFQHQVASGR